MQPEIESSEKSSYEEEIKHLDAVTQIIASESNRSEKFNGTETELVNSILDKAIDTIAKENLERTPYYRGMIYKDLITLHAENNLKLAALNQLCEAARKYNLPDTDSDILHVPLKEYAIFVDPEIRRYAVFFEDTTYKESEELSLSIDRSTYVVHRVIEAFSQRYLGSYYSKNRINEDVLVKSAELSGFTTYQITDDIKLVKMHDSYVFETGIGTTGSLGSHDEIDDDGVWIPAKYAEELTYESLIRKENDFRDDEEFADTLITHLQHVYPNIKAETNFFRYETLHESGQQFRVSFDTVSIIKLAKETELNEDDFIKTLCKDISTYIVNYRKTSLT